MVSYYSDIKSVFRIATEKRPPFDLPKIEKISIHLPKIGGIGKFEVWDLKSVSQRQALKIGLNPETSKKTKNLVKINFKFKMVDGVPAIVDAFNHKYRWEFFGVVRTDRGERAIFFNPFLKGNGLKLVGVGMNLDNYLRLTDLNNDNVTVEFAVDNRTKKFVFSVFNVDISKYKKGGLNK